MRLAACALLLEVAYADDDFVANERQHLVDVVRRHFRLKPEDAHELISARRGRAPGERGAVGLHDPDPRALLGRAENGAGGGDVGLGARQDLKEAV